MLRTFQSGSRTAGLPSCASDCQPSLYAEGVPRSASAKIVKLLPDERYPPAGASIAMCARVDDPSYLLRREHDSPDSLTLLISVFQRSGGGALHP